MAKTTLRNYQHATRIFRDGNSRLTPKYGFLFYVEFDFNPLITNVSNTAARELGMIVKSCNLPKFTVDTKIHNAYNRKNISQQKISYDPINIVFHDDQADNVRNFWYDYYSFFYRDSDYADATYNIIHKYQERPAFEWGYSPRPVASFNSGNAYQEYQYIQAIRIYSMYQNNFSEYELVNPMITQFKHGDHANGETNLLEHSMQVQYEAVKYQTGYVTHDTAAGFIDLHYDTTPSPLGGTAAADSASHTITDLANFNLNTAGGAVIPQPSAGIINATNAFSSVGAFITNLNAATTPNSGGFALPALGSLTSGISNGAIVGQQLQAATVALAGQAASTLASGVVKGISSGLGPQGSQVLGLAAAAIANPQAALRTVENMAVKFAMGAVSQGVNSLATQAGQRIATEISGALSPISTGISNAFGDVSSYLSGQVTGLQTSLTFGSSGTTLFGGITNGGTIGGDIIQPDSFGGVADIATAD